MNHHSQHDAALADIIWWLKGFSAACPPDFGEPSEAQKDATRLAAGAQAIRDWLDVLAAGQMRLIGRGEHCYSIVLSDEEFWIVHDGLSPNATKDRRGQARATISDIWKQAGDELHRGTIDF